MAYVPVPKDLANVKTKIFLNLTKRQLIFFSLAAVTGVPTYLFLKDKIDPGLAAILMVTVMLPFFFMAMYEKDGLPFEKIIANIIRQKVLYPPVRPYKTENFYKEIDELVKEESLHGEKVEKRKTAASASGSGKKKQKGKKKKRVVQKSVPDKKGKRSKKAGKGKKKKK